MAKDTKNTAAQAPARSKVDRLVQAQAPMGRILARGWVRTVRDHKEFGFLEINDGSCLVNLQVVADAGTPAYVTSMALGMGTSVEVLGEHVASPGAGQNWEVRADTVRVIGSCPKDYPLQKNRHSDEFLRGISHLRPRTNKYGAILRIRSRMSLAIHDFFRERGFFYVHTPIITPLDCEGAGDMFRVAGPGDGFAPEETFFGKTAHLTVSGQLEAEMLACALGDVYTFGPTFRAENSHTKRHAAEFWMVEPEMAFCDLVADMDVAEAFVRFLITRALDECAEDLGLFFRFVDKTLQKALESMASQAFERVSYSEAIRLLTRCGESFQFEPAYGKDLQTEHERVLTEKIFKKPVIVHDWPAEIKPFYMRVSDDGKTVAAMDVLAPRVGEIIGGSQREERVDVLEKRMAAQGLSRKEYWWYLESRRYGTVAHAGFGMGFERFLMMLTGVGNIRDIACFPRTPGSLDF